MRFFIYLLNLLSLWNIFYVDCVKTPNLPLNIKSLFEEDSPTILSSDQPNSCPLQQSKFSCDPSNRYSELDGSCNNLNEPWLGKSSSYYKRYLPADYSDGMGSPRRSQKSNSSLPNPRLISLAMVTSAIPQFEANYTHMLPSFGQFVTHDMTDFLISSDENGSELPCPCDIVNYECLSYKMMKNDIMKINCSSFARGASAANLVGCNFKKREQLNKLTAFIDCTQIYGMNLERSNDLRLFDGGLLRTSQGLSSARKYLPLSKTNICSPKDPMRKCFIAGEDRTSENIGLAGLQTLFMREHNRIAQQLSKVNPRWNDQKLFMESRKIIIAIMQNIVFGQWLPSVIGKSYATKLSLLPNRNSYFDGYDPKISPALANDFSTGAFRFGHTLVRNTMHRFNKYGKQIPLSLNTTDLIAIVDEAYDTKNGGLETLFLGLINELSSKFDTNFADALQNRLVDTVEPTGTSPPFDLAATNINRGRDHGIPGYVKYVEKCGYGTIESFQDLENLIPQDKINLLKAIYEDVNDIDLYVGGLSEYQVPDGVIGPTFACIVAKQFNDIKRSDRFYFENGPSQTSFSHEQLNEIRKISLARLICNDFDLESIQENVFLMASSSNKKVSCENLPNINFKKWRRS